MAVADAPVLDALAALKAADVDHLELDPLAGRRDSHELALVGTREPGPRPHLVAVGGHVLDVALEVWKTRVDPAHEVLEPLAALR
jgi:hypothetical protein